MSTGPLEQARQHAETIAGGAAASVDEIRATAATLRAGHRVAPIAPMLAAVGRRALRGELERADAIELAKVLRDHQQFGYARRLLRRLRLVEDGERLRQQHALCTYKDMELPALRRLDGAMLILLGDRDLHELTSAETLGIAGAIYKRKWEVDAKRGDLERALTCYKRGFAIEGDDERWYTGINAAFVADQLAELADREREQGFGTAETAKLLRRDADEIRRTIVDEHVRDNGDWTAATLGEAYFGLEDHTEALKHLSRAGDDTGLWQRETTAMQLAALGRLRRVPDDHAAAALKALVNDRDGAVRRAGTGKVGLALSGGGFRASLFHLGVLARLAECNVLRRVEVLSCVSGGSIVGAFYYLELRELLQSKPDGEIEDIDYVRLVERVARDFLHGVRQNLRGRLFTGLRANARMMATRYSRTDRTAELLDELFFSDPERERDEPLRMSDLLITPCGEPEGFSLRYENWMREAQVPMLVINATTLNTGHAWQFTASGMGEPPAGREEQVDATRRLRRIHYEIDGQRAPRLSTAVAASACVPMLFAPVKLEGLYDGVDVELVDGGVHDNQGIASLHEQDCTIMLVSDASGLLADKLSPGRNPVGLAWRTQNVLMSRVRGAQLDELAGRKRAGTLRRLMMVHLKKGLAAPPRDPAGCDDPYDPEDDPLAPGTRRSGSGYGIHPDVQRALSELRTDLDSFTDAEAYGLMAAGYAMTKVELSAAMDGLFPVVDELASRAAWPFAATLAGLDQPSAARALRRSKLRMLRGAMTWSAPRPRP